FLLVMPGINSCKKEGDVFPDSVTITFKIYDDQDLLITGAKISIYDSYQAYLNGVAANNIGFAIDSALSSPGGSTFVLQPKTDYWILVTYDDVVRTLKLSNTSLSAQLDKLDKSSVINAIIRIVPNTCNISFWTDASNPVPIEVIFNNIDDTVYNTMPSAPLAPGNTNSLNFSVQPGTYSYYAKGPRNCLWTGAVTVGGGAFRTIQLNTCNTGQITFYTTQPNTLGTTYPISVVLDNLDNAGLVPSAVASPYICGSPLDPNALTVFRDPNTYTYVAKTADGRCTWTGSFTLAPNGCVSIPLPLCP
ncbi:MAG: hypothetical protein ACJ75J_05025, partial [Cytophagaceae bacterium]